MDSSVDVTVDMPVEASDSDSEASNEEGNTPATPANTEAVKRRHKVKIDKEELEVDEDELIRGYQRAQSANKRYEEAAKTRKQAEQFLNQLKTNPKAILTNPKLGLDFKKLAEEYLAEQYEQELLSPEELNTRKEQAELKKYRDQEQAAKAKLEEQQEAQLKESLRGDYEKQIMGAMEKTGVPRTAETVKRMVAYASKNLEQGYELSMDDIAEIVKEDYLNDVKAMFGGLEGDQLLAMLGEDVSNKIRKSDLAKLKSSQKQAREETRSNTNQARPASSTEPKKKLSSADFLRDMRNSKK